jgi:hypothetical protein
MGAFPPTRAALAGIHPLPNLQRRTCPDISLWTSQVSNRPTVQTNYSSACPPMRMPSCFSQTVIIFDQFSSPSPSSWYHVNSELACFIRNSGVPVTWAISIANVESLCSRSSTSGSDLPCTYAIEGLRPNTLGLLSPVPSSSSVGHQCDSGPCMASIALFVQLVLEAPVGSDRTTQHARWANAESDNPVDQSRWSVRKACR